ncbi:MAG: hypothetical protein C0467_11400 [Planctomycetaceae bacterium]|nr:hypothetical protein [Planctomycetaceae bacterium]
MDPETEEYLLVALWAVAAIWAVWFWVPMFLMCTIGSGYENGGTEDPTAIEPDGRDPNYELAFNTLRELGYEPLGPGFMRLWFYGWYWAYRTKVMTFRSRASGQFAFVQQHPHPFTGYNQIFFATCWDERRILLTTGGVAAATQEEEHGVTKVWDTENIPELERHHRDESAKLIAAGWRRDSDQSLEHLLGVTRDRANARRGLDSRVHRGNFVRLLAAYLFFTILPAWEFELSWWAPVASLCIVTFYRFSGIQSQLQQAEAVRIKVAQDRMRGPVFADSKVGTP